MTEQLEAATIAPSCGAWKPPAAGLIEVLGANTPASRVCPHLESATLVAAHLSLTYTPINKGAGNDFVSALGLPLPKSRVRPALLTADGTLTSGKTCTIEADLTDYYSSKDLQTTMESHGYRLLMSYSDDGLLDEAHLTVKFAVCND